MSMGVIMDGANIILLAFGAYISGFGAAYFIQELRFVWHKKVYEQVKAFYESRNK